MKNLATICTLILVLVITGCSKYEEGGFSLRSKKARLVNKWKLEKLYMDGNEMQIQGQPPSAGDFWVEFKKDESFENFFGVNGKWEFDDSKEHIKLFDDNANLIHELRIIKLKENELIFDYEFGGLLEAHYKTY